MPHWYKRVHHYINVWVFSDCLPSTHGRHTIILKYKNWNHVSNLRFNGPTASIIIRVYHLLTPGFSFMHSVRYYGSIDHDLPNAAMPLNPS